MVQSLEMHVARPGDATALAARRVDLPPPELHQICVSIEAAGVAYADVVMRRGLYAGHKPPVTPGYDFVGRIEALGADVTGLSIGQRVCGITVNGSYADRRNVDADLVVPAPDGVHPEIIVSAVLNGVTAWQMLRRVAKVDSGDWILVHGAAGGVGTMLLDMARHLGVKAIGTASMRKLGVIEARGGIPLDYAVDDVRERSKAISEGGVAAAFDHIGGRHFRSVSLRTLRPGGTAILYGGYEVTRDGRMRPLSLLDFLANGFVSSRTLFGASLGVAGYSVPVWLAARRQAYREDLSEVLDMVARSEIEPLCGATFPLGQAADAHRALEARSLAGKIVLVP